jgi:DNA-binding response OmpR family regulator
MAILVVDSAAQVRGCVRAILEKHGYQSREAPDGPTALKEVRSKPDQISLIVTHIDARNGSPGIQLAQSVRAEYPHMPVLFTSALDHSLEGLQLVVPGCRFLLKPFTAPALLSAIRELLAGTG